jgi:homeobox domain-containing protein
VVWSTVAGKSLPVHCVVEAVSALDDSRVMWRRKPVVETDSYVIIPVNTAFQELVQVALHRLGYPRDSASAAKGEFEVNVSFVVT